MNDCARAGSRSWYLQRGGRGKPAIESGHVWEGMVGLVVNSMTSFYQEERDDYDDIDIASDIGVEEAVPAIGMLASLLGVGFDMQDAPVHPVASKWGAAPVPSGRSRGFQIDAEGLGVTIEQRPRLASPA